MNQMVGPVVGKLGCVCDGKSSLAQKINPQHIMDGSKSLLKHGPSTVRPY